MFRRITAAGSRLLKAEGGEGGHFYTLEGLNSLVLQLITTHPSLVLLWCQVLLIINYTNYTWWSEVHQTPRSDYIPNRKACLIDPTVTTRLSKIFGSFRKSNGVCNGK